jgi:hypothetical protein
MSRSSVEPIVYCNEQLIRKGKGCPGKGREGKRLSGKGKGREKVVREREGKLLRAIKGSGIKMTNDRRG